MTLFNSEVNGGSKSIALIKHQNKKGIPWLYFRTNKGEVSGLQAIENFDFDDISVPKRDKTKHWIFSLKKKEKEVAMIRCSGFAAMQKAVDESRVLILTRERIDHEFNN